MTTAAGNAIQKFSLNLSLIAQSCPLHAAIVVSDINDRLSPNIAPPITDATIAACNGQDCAMRDKFRENFWIAFPAAVVTLVIILILSFGTDISGRVTHEYNLVQVIPYVFVLIGGIAGINVFVVLLIGISVPNESKV